MDTTAPQTLTTSRLTMTPFAVDDFADCLAMRSDAVVTRLVSGVMTREDVWFRTLRNIGHWQALGFGPWTVRESATGRFVGEIGFFDSRRMTEPDFAGPPEAGWMTNTWAHGQGYASEAVAAMLAWGDARPGFGRIVCMIDPGNDPSLRLAQRFGFRRISDLTYKGNANVLLERLRT